MNTIRDMTNYYLCKHGFDGLFSDAGCACLIGDLMPCDEPSPNCRAGYKRAPIPGEFFLDGDFGGGEGWIVSAKK